MTARPEIILSTDGLTILPLDISGCVCGKYEDSSPIK